MKYKQTLFFIGFLYSIHSSAELIISPKPVEVVDYKAERIQIFDGDTLTSKDLNFNKLHSSDSGSLLNYFSGVNSATNAGVSSMPVINGLSNDRIKVKIDGMDIAAACASHMNSPLTYIDASKVNEISVFSGLTPVSIGGDSLGGSIIINSVNPYFSNNNEQIVNGKIRTFYRSNSETIGGSIEGTLVTDSLFINYNGSYEDAKNYKSGGAFKSAGTPISGTPGWVDGNEVGSSAYKISNQMLSIGIKEGNDLVTLKLSQQDTPFQGFPNQRMDSTKNESQQVNLAYEGTFDWGGLEARFYQENTDHQHNFGPDKKFFYTTAVGMPMNADGKNLGITMKANVFLSDLDLLTFGSEYHSQKLDDWWNASGTSGMMQPNDFQNINNGSRDRFDIFSEWARSWDSSLLTSFGLRYGQVRSNTDDVHGYQDSNGMGSMMHYYKRDSDSFNASKKSKVDHNIDASLLAEFIQSEILSYEMGYALKNRSPNLYERYTWSTWTRAANMNNTYGDGNGYVGNLDLDPETSHTISFTADFHDSSRSISLIRVTPYFTYVDDYIDAVACSKVGKTCPSRSDGFSNLSFKNQSAKIYGFDLSAYQLITRSAKYGQFSTSGIMSYVKGKNDDTKDDLYRQMPLNIKLTLDHQLGRWTNRFESVVVRKKNNISSIRNELKTSGYALINILTNYTYEQAQLNLGITNVFDKQYDDPLGGSYLGQGATMSTGVTNGKAVPGMGRSFNFSLSLDF